MLSPTVATLPYPLASRVQSCFLQEICPGRRRTRNEIAALPGLQRIHGNNAGPGMQVIGINTCENMASSDRTPAPIVASRNVTCPSAIAKKKTPSNFQVKSLHTHCVLDRAGRFVYYTRSAHANRDFEKDLRSVINSMFSHGPY